MSSTHAAFMFSALDKYVSFGISLATTAIVARLLTPSDVGLFAIVSIVAVTAESLRDFGVGVYIIQHPDPQKETLRTAFTVMALVALLLAAVLLALAAPIARFYSAPALALGIALSVGSLAAGCFASPCLALLRREMDFASLALINVSGVAANLIGVLIFHAFGLGFLSLVLGSLLASVTTASLAAIKVGKPWIFMPSLRDWRGVASFGSFASATSALTTIHTSLPQLLLGRLAGIDVAGFFNRSYLLCQIPDRFVVGAFLPVVFPAFAAQARAGADLKALYLKALTLLSAIHWPALLVLAILAEPAVRIVLGPQWDACAPLVRIMALAWLIMMPASLTYPILVASGRIRDTVTSCLISLPPSMLVIFAMAPFGAAALAWSMFATLAFQMGVAFVFIRRQIAFGWMELIASVAKSAAVAACSAAGPLLVAGFYGFTAEISFMALTLAGGTAFAGWLAGLSASRHPLLEEVRSFASSRRPSRRAAAV
ncbi:oligosaccharide flippase family protein [Afifella sp. IM 167]|uniref:oligosaccharide flippase family protein n=1 Tax=Afifella sp. IM 167 TaxID=2033586 RepID=UPI001CCC6FA5|nr:oligosaccharide flippase family protein [Afifella sp. IM 167]MBZ8134449.1 polysaccharide biosynthesis protein [Afifella sp. IM 167]